MLKTIKIDGKEIRFESNAALGYVFKAQCGYDILTVLLPMLSELLANADELFEKKSGSILPSDIGTLLEGVYSLELSNIQDLIWTMAKLADDGIAEPTKWYAQFEEFPLLDVSMELFPMLLSTMISKKKLSEMRIPSGNVLTAT